MREIKFRAWDKQEKEMKPWWAIRRIQYNHEHELVEDTDGYGKHNDIFKDPDLILMQYIGLEDKNGVEIYEGDIYREGKRLRVVVFTSGCFMGDYKNGTSQRFIAAEDITVIGNIYENRELKI